MWPWGHLAFGYLFESVWKHRREGRPPTGLETLALAIGTQFPDLIDKPFAWTFDVLPSGRSLTHSVFTTMAVVSIAYVVLEGRSAREYVGPFALGYVSHLLGDSVRPVLAGDEEDVGFLAWPLASTDYGVETGVLAHFARLQPSDLLGPEGGIVALSLFVWVFDGRPGPGEFGALLVRVYEGVRSL